MLKAVTTFFEGLPWPRIMSKASSTNEVGIRLFPSKTPKKDAKSNLRMDKGATDEATGKVELILQANINAEDSSVRKAAQRDSHAILASVMVDPKAYDEGEVVREAMADYVDRRDHPGETKQQRWERKEKERKAKGGT